MSSLKLGAALVSLVLSYFVSGTVATVPFDVPDAVKRADCAQISVRKEWRDFTNDEKADYIRGVKCLMALPPKEKRKATSRFEEFQETHILLAERVHSVGHFLPWHRYLVTLYSNALRDECGYNGPSAFWDWSRDADRSQVRISSSPIFDPNTGFGGDGVPGTYRPPPDPNNESGITRAYRGCIGNGPFKDVVIHLGPGKLVTTHCITRGIDESYRSSLTSRNVNNTINNARTFERFRTAVDGFLNGAIHGAGHGTIGGEMQNVYSSSADPLFYLHHANLDRVWWRWQNVNPSARTYDVSGPSLPGERDQITLNFVMDFPALAPNITVREVMDTKASSGCYTYAY